MSQRERANRQARRESRSKRERASRQASREAAPAQSALARQRQSAKRDFRKDKRSIRGQENLLQNAISQARGEVKSSGLKGKYLKSALAELAERRVDAAASVPFLTQQARSTRNDALSTVRSQAADLAGQEGLREQEILQGLRQAQAERQAEKADVGKGLREDRQDAKSDRAAAARAANNLYLLNQKKFSPETIEEEYGGSEDLAWRDLEESLISSIGGDRRDARRLAEEATRRLRGKVADPTGIVGGIGALGAGVGSAVGGLRR